MEPNMFCYQCQETAKGTGCILKGVCGKESHTAQAMDLLLFVGVSSHIFITENSQDDRYLGDPSPIYFSGFLILYDPWLNFILMIK